MNEIWKDIKGFEGKYQVSNFGNVKSFSRGEHLLRLNGGKKYIQVILCKNGKTYAKLVHRLVADAFISNPNNFPCVNHKDENPKNNCVDNLEWCSYRYNNVYNDRVEKCKLKISNALLGRKREYTLTAEQRKNISDGAKRGWAKRKSAILEEEDV